MMYARSGRPPYGNPHQQVYANQQFTQGPHGMTNPAAAAQAMAARYPSTSPYNQRPQSLMLDGQEGAAVDMYHSPVATPQQMAAAAMYRRPPGYYTSSQGSPAQSPHGQVHVRHVTNVPYTLPYIF